MFEVENLCDRVLFIEKGRIGRELSEESLADGDRHIVAVSSEKNSLVGGFDLFPLKEEIDGELYFGVRQHQPLSYRTLSAESRRRPNHKHIYKEKDGRRRTYKDDVGDGHENA